MRTVKMNLQNTDGPCRRALVGDDPGLPGAGDTVRACACGNLSTENVCVLTAGFDRNRFVAGEY